jgi:hypothetical protein
MYIQHIHGLCHSRLSTADYALFLVASATTVVYYKPSASYIGSARSYTQKTHQLLSNGYPVLSRVSTHALPSNGHPVAAYSLLRDVFTGLLPSNGCPFTV